MIPANHPIIEGNVLIGDGCYIQSGCRISGISGKVIIGKNNIFEENVLIQNQNENGDDMIIGNFNHFKEGCVVSCKKVFLLFNILNFL